MSRIRKAIVAAAGAGFGAAVTVVAKSDWKLDSTVLAQALAAFAIAAVPVGLATYRVKNAK